MRPRVSVIFGTRPEAIKLAPVILEFQKRGIIDCHVCVTGQHRQMLDQVLDVFKITPDTDLSLMQANQSLAALSARAIEALDKYLEQSRPDLIVVQGDTTTVFCATLAAFYRKIPVGHVEAGLRTWNLNAPWPEEANRVLATRLARLHFAPTQSARENLLKEGVPSGHITVTGNTVVDALLFALDAVRRNPPLITDLPAALQPSAPQSNGHSKVVLITGHRRENFGEGFEQICRAIKELSERHPEVHFVYPVHLNPNVREPVNRILAGNQEKAAPNIHLIEPLSYLPFVAMMNRATVILTDSGGVQEEAPSLAKPVLVMRDTTERPEAVDAGVVQLVGTRQDLIINEVTKLIRADRKNDLPIPAKNPYGDGKAAERIADQCELFLLQGR
jgi:UDP-N-acetylglucosamine 2-epimerase (non-hydrolysing)